ncbi:MAG: hypothetical protein OEY38_21000 [Gammaproteobacteria bacterium]|nr:hypothetical protein [Gammaproteobacteria bacterium]
MFLKKSPYSLLLGVSVFILMLISIGLLTRVSSVYVSGEILTHTIDMNYSAWPEASREINSQFELKGGKFLFKQVDYVGRVPNTASNDKHQTEDKKIVRVTGKESKALDIQFSPVNKIANIVFEHEKDELYLYSKAASVNGYIAANNDYDVSIIENERVSNQKMSRVYYATQIDEKDSVPFSMFVEQVIELKMVNNVNLKSLLFSREEPAGTNKFRSAIISGKLTMPDTKQEFHFRELQPLEIEFEHCDYFVVSSEEGRLKILFEGIATKIDGGHYRHRENLMPSWLYYFYHSNFVQMIWAAMLLIWGTIFGFRKYYRENSSS